MVKKRILSVILAAAMCAGISVMPALADGASPTVSAPRYYRVEKTLAVDGYDALRRMEAPDGGVFTDIVTWGAENNYGTITGTFKSEADVSGGSEASLYGAVYEDGALAGAGVDKKASGTLSVTSDVGAGQTFKSLIWDSAMKPIETEAEAPEIRFFYCDDPNTVTIAWSNKGGSYSLYKNNAQVDISGLSPIGVGSYRNMGKYPIYIYTDASAAAGDTYVVKNGAVSSEALVADFSAGASVTLGKYVAGRNMAYLRNDNGQWWHNSVSEHKIVAGRECDVRVYKSYDANNKTNEKWTNFYFKVDGDYLSGSGNTLDVTINYFDVGTEPLWLYYYPDSDPSQTTRVAAVDNMTNSKTWKTVTKRISGVTLAADTGLDDEYQMFLTSGTGSAISGVSVAPYYDTTVSTLRAANVYTDGVELRWTMASTSGITGYTIKRNGTAIATNYQHRTYYDKNLDNDTQYTYTVTAETTSGLGTESDPLVTRTQKDQLVSMTLPLSGEDTTYTAGGLSIWLNTDDRFDPGMTQVKTRGDKQCRATLCRNASNPRTAGDLWYDYYTWTSGVDRRSTYMCFTVDNSIISADDRNVTIEFDYYDVSESTVNGQSVEVKYLKYNDGGTPTVGTKTAATIAGSNTWKTAKVTLTDAQFNHASRVLISKDGTPSNYDFMIGMSTNRGGVASTYVKAYVPGAVSMPEHELYAEVNSDGTAMEGTLPINIWSGSYDRDIGFSGTDGLSAVGGKHYAYNKEFAGYTQPNQGYKRWRNAFYFKVPDDFLYGSDYEKVEIEVEYYAPTGTQIVLGARNSSGDDKDIGLSSAVTGQWTTKKFTITPDDGYGVVFSNKFDSSADFRFTFRDAQGYVNKVTIKKDYLLED